MPRGLGLLVFGRRKTERIMKIFGDDKISGGFWPAQEARDFATPRSVLSAVRKQDLNRIDALLQGPTALMSRVGSQPSH